MGIYTFPLEGSGTSADSDFAGIRVRKGRFRSGRGGDASEFREAFQLGLVLGLAWIISVCCAFDVRGS